MKKAIFDWVPFYKELAEKLLSYKNNRKELIDKIKEIYNYTGLKLPTLEKDNNLIDIDPFTVFGLFNKSSMKEDNRIKIIKAVAMIFNINSSIPSSFDSIPVLNNLNATFYYFIDSREKDDIDHLWEFFESAVNYSHNHSIENKSSFSTWFDIIINKKGNGNSKITMALFWIDPDLFFNLDSRNVWFVYESGKIPFDFVQTLPKVENKISAGTYFEIAEKMNDIISKGTLPFHNFKELSYEAWLYSTEVNKIIKEENEKSKRDAINTTLADDADTIHYWIYSPGRNATKWDEFYDENIMAIGWDELGDLNKYNTKKEIVDTFREINHSKSSFKNDAGATWQFANEMKPGDMVFVKKGKRIIIGCGIVVGDYEYDENRDEYKNIRRVKWTQKGEWEHPGEATLKTLTDITNYTDYVETLKELFDDDFEDEFEEQAVSYSEYNKEHFLKQVYISETEYDNLCALLKNKKNVILQGPPGVGKTYAAKRLAYSIMGEKDASRVKMVQFHQSYSYEDFMMGFRPNETGFKLHKGAFYEFCKTAEEDSENDYFFIIDEINRGNLSKIFGELFMLIESDKRGIALQLLYSDEQFSIPDNLYIIGMMNTADRSLALLDYALRRRFAFFDMKPSFDSVGFKDYQKSLNSSVFDNLILTIKELNREIVDDDSLGEGFSIGHSYFCNMEETFDETLDRIVEYEIIPLLKEYWFDEKDKVRRWSDRLRSAIQ